jgi:hypothetical protein
MVGLLLGEHKFDLNNIHIRVPIGSTSLFEDTNSSSTLEHSKARCSIQPPNHQFLITTNCSFNLPIYDRRHAYC